MITSLCCDRGRRKCRRSWGRRDKFWPREWDSSRVGKGREDLPGREVLNRWDIWGPAGRSVCLEYRVCPGRARAKAGSVSRAHIGEVFD